MISVPDCGQPHSVSDASWELDNDSDGQSATLICKDGFYLNNVVQIYCTSNNTWTNIDDLCMPSEYIIVVSIRLLHFQLAAIVW